MEVVVEFVGGILVIEMDKEIWANVGKIWSLLSVLRPESFRPLAIIRPSQRNDLVHIRKFIDKQNKMSGLNANLKFLDCICVMLMLINGDNEQTNTREGEIVVNHDSSKHLKET